MRNARVPRQRLHSVRSRLAVFMAIIFLVGVEGTDAHIDAALAGHLAAGRCAGDLDTEIVALVQTHTQVRATWQSAPFDV